ncbi:ABC transporter permease [Paenibacillus xylaniclasticus]|uniref:ABC transporter permease n=1 Tax=Paenibacillus xylaniclasticus TaxID=588083 RepID=UPI000FDBAE37|nr:MULTISPECIES: ABC transporter permease [Paenibacillus]GFN30074.1 ABC transporter permease [Paenibacillus curdlanolyticus]
MNFAAFSLKRLGYFLPQLIGVIIVAFLVIRLTPGDPILRITGGMASEGEMEKMRERMGLDGSLLDQLIHYFKQLFHGDMGVSWFTSQQVTSDLFQRFPATLELITISLILSLLLSIVISFIAAFGPNTFIGKLTNRIVKGYSFLAGAVPDFWIGILLILLFYSTLGIAPNPMGRYDLTLASPPSVTGFLTIDSIISGRFDVLMSYLSHLMLPVATLVFVYSGNILKITTVSIGEALSSPYMKYARSFGVGKASIIRYALKNALPSIITISGITYTYLLGGAVLIESIFGWGGMGEYAIQSAVNTDFPAMQGFILLSAAFSLFVYLLVDLLYFIINPRMRYE